MCEDPPAHSHYLLGEVPRFVAILSVARGSVHMQRRLQTGLARDQPQGQQTQTHTRPHLQTTAQSTPQTLLISRTMHRISPMLQLSKVLELLDNY